MSIFATVGVIVAYGMCLGIGFWISKKITNQLDVLMLSKSDKEQLAGVMG